MLDRCKYQFSICFLVILTMPNAAGLKEGDRTRNGKLNLSVYHCLPLGVYSLLLCFCFLQFFFFFLPLPIHFIFIYSLSPSLLAMFLACCFLGEGEAGGGGIFSGYLSH